MELVHDRSRRTKTAEAEYSRLLSPTSQSSKRRSQTKTSKKQPTRDEMMYRREREKLTLSTSWHRYYYLPDQAREWEFTHTHKSSPVQSSSKVSYQLCKKVGCVRRKAFRSLTKDPGRAKTSSLIVGSGTPMWKGVLSGGLQSVGE